MPPQTNRQLPLLGPISQHRTNPLRFEHALYRRGCRSVAGVDEVGRGALAGPVFAAAVILPPDLVIPGVDDSKKLTPETREDLYPIIIQSAISWSVASISRSEIDRINIHRASLKAMARAVTGLEPRPQFVLVDGRFPLPLGLPQRPLIRGDSLSHSIAAASIVAKVSRDRWMVKQAKRYPQFYFELHKGYGTLRHREAISIHGLTPLHRRSFSIKTWP